MSSDEDGFELKFAAPASLAPLLQGFLRARFLPDGAHPEAEVVSLYYDTGGWDLLNEKTNSTYLKMKFRVRHYRVRGTAAGSPVFAEVKYKIGCRRRKLRLRLPGIDGAALESLRLDDPWLAGLPALACRELAIELPPLLLPAFTVEYRRMRFVAPISRSRLCIDHAIRGGRVHPSRIVSARPDFLPHLVFEQKGAYEHLLPEVRPVLAQGLRKEAFSKYYRMFSHLTGLTI